VIQSFADKDLEAAFQGKRVGRFAQIQAALERKLAVLDAAESLRDLSAVPGNRLERIHTGEYSMRVNVQWRLVFRWADAGPTNVKVEDYH
jgi:toxin HigB-1